MTGGKRQRLDKVLAHIGHETRKEIKAMVRDGRVSLNGIIVSDPGIHVTAESDLIEVDGVAVLYREFIYLVMNKPQGVVSATEDTREQTVVDLLPDEYIAFKPFPVGRLDKDTEGLLLITNDGQLSHRLLSPKHHVPKIYYAQIDGHVTEGDVEAFSEGVTLDDGYRTLPGQLRILTTGTISTIEITIYEGKFHQVKRMFEAVGKKVVYLQRIQMGNIALDSTLKLGESRELRAEELEGLRSIKENQES